MHTLRLAATWMFAVSLFAQVPPPDSLRITILDGDQAINNIRQRTAREPIVQVEDENHNRVPGAIVVFTLPGSGPGGSFAGAGNTLSTITDAEGKAIARGFHTNNLTGKFEIRVNASYQGKTGHATITQTNAGTVAVTHTARWVTISIVAGAAVAGGVFAATRGGGGVSLNGSPTPTPPTVTAGTGTVGPPPH